MTEIKIGKFTVQVEDKQAYAFFEEMIKVYSSEEIVCSQILNCDDSADAAGDIVYDLYKQQDKLIDR